MKTLALMIAASLMSAAYALHADASCDLSSQSRAVSVASYVEDGKSCLEDLPGGYGIDPVMEAAFLAHVNKARLARDLPPLILRPELAPAARWHSLDMAANDFFSHKGSDQRSAGHRITAFDRTLLSSVQRENIAAIRGPYDPETVVKRLHDGLMNSKSHRQSILADDISHIGLGVITRRDGVWVTQVFVRQDGEFSRHVPLRIEAGSEIQQAVSLKGWAASGLAVRKSDKTTKIGSEGKLSGRIPTSMRGTYSLTVRGEKPGARKGSRLYIHFTGPRTEIVAPSSS
ncbi:CAP domain-containing protein [Henriciella sp.]|uniref:CAP domain-containing protein n=1 Tax=Henriciella sp. TaxID=1968823 RepID=UPI0026093DA4|nr:CAP domain-containing protein [Henriciella sp.]